ncbi:MAG: HepT-like ribonuclease domain-containing protein [Thermoleophilaceae bacterium]
MAGKRDRLAHDYFGVDLALVWDVVANELPPTRERLAALLETQPSGPTP